MEKKAAKQPNRTVVDAHGSHYKLTGKLGEGGQGTVCTTNYPNVLVKISKRLSPEAKHRTDEHLIWLMRQHLDALYIARPVALINSANRSGYVMELMDGLNPLTEALKAMQEEGAEGFLRTGGLRRRLKLLAKLARTLAKLHGRGLAYGDLSPANIFVSKDVEFAEVWLIDCDNISYHSRSSDIRLYTPDYGAPEILRGISGINTFTDSWSFAVIAYQLLTMKHPLKGDLVNDGEPELEEQALQGDFPWVEHPDDDQNQCTGGIPSELVFTKRLRELMDQCFRLGMNDPDERPSLAAWSEAFAEASVRLLDCENCHSTFYYNKTKQCPFCDHEQAEHSNMVIKEYFWLPADVLPEGANSMTDCWISTGRVAVIQQGSRLPLTSIMDSSIELDSETICHVELAEDGLWIEPFMRKNVVLQRDGKAEPLSRKMYLKAESRTQANFMLHLGDMTQAHPVWRFIW